MLPVLAFHSPSYASSFTEPRRDTTSDTRGLDRPGGHRKAFRLAGLRKGLPSADSAEGGAVRSAEQKRETNKTHLWWVQ